MIIFYDDFCFLTYIHSFRRQSSASMETEECLSTLLAKDGDHHLESGENQLKQLGEILIRPSKFQLILDVIELSPDDLKVRAFRKGFLVSAAHREKLDNGKEYVTNHFYREYILPKAIRPEEVTSWITTENLLFIEAPKKIHDDDDDDDVDVNNESGEDHSPSDDEDDDQFDDYEDQAIDVEILRQV